MAFKGMDPGEGNEVAQAVTQAGEQILEAVGDMTTVVNSVEWVGPDYDGYKEEWNSFIGGPLANLVEALQQKGKELTQHAEEQEQESNNG
ncbi:hypothetical protein CFK41_05925 [Brachybacterium ginsengisoli]|uniref:WXG100 family type VII secretion target n=1 Tax=Brachybacterium ginsengisoli TaxID=1331682 RepID=A0A291GW41_9MICO|nr:hypothetical protein [Brachybacterium ginsengisoli]ATG54362.1 hypothetical protein CFK41_05925 [Brachybacterium ginsengisoli]